MGESSNIVWSQSHVSADERARLLHQRGGVCWFTGLSGSGKSTIARAVERHLIDAGHLAYVLDGDNLRHGLCSDLGFSAEDRQENIRRAAAVAALIADTGAIVLTAFISPYAADRHGARDAIGTERFFEIFMDSPIDVCESRDPKGLYKRARAGTIPRFTGISDPYEAPAAPDLRLPSHDLPIPAAVEQVMDLLRRHSFLPGAAPESETP